MSKKKITQAFQRLQIPLNTDLNSNLNAKFSLLNALNLKNIDQNCLRKISSLETLVKVASTPLPIHNPYVNSVDEVKLLLEKKQTPANLYYARAVKMPKKVVGKTGRRKMEMFHAPKALMIYVLVSILLALLVAARLTAKTPSKLLAVLGSGGHSAELIRLLVPFYKNNVNLKYYFLTTDHLSIQKLNNSIIINQLIASIPRPRKVHQSYFSSIFTTIYSMLWAVCYVAYIHPDVLVCNGPGICVPVVFSVFLLKIFKKTRIVFVESFTKVNSLSLTGKIVYHFCDLFVVQWKPLAVKYPNAVYFGERIL